MTDCGWIVRAVFVFAIVAVAVGFGYLIGRFQE